MKVDDLTADGITNDDTLLKSWSIDIFRVNRDNSLTFVIMVQTLPDSAFNTGQILEGT